jgi:hypothetical protein
MTVGGWGEWLKNMRSNGEKPFKMTRENNHDEHIIQEDIVAYLRGRWCIPIDTDVMDGNKWATSDLARIKYINIHKARGYTNGQPDLVVLMPSGRTLLVEVKTPHGRQSEAQKAYQTAAENLGYEYVIWRSVDDAKKFFAKDVNVQTTGSGGCPLPHSSPLSKDKE